VSLLRQIIKEYIQTFNKTLNLPGISWWIIDYKEEPSYFHCNELMEEMFSLDKNLKYHSVSETCPIAGDYNNNIASKDADIAKKIFDDYEKLLTQENEVYCNVFPYYNEKSNKTMYFSSRALVLEKTNNGDVSVLYGLIEDITSSEEHKIELRYANDDISNLNMQLQEHSSKLEQQVELRTHELKLAKDKAETANNAKTEFLSSMSHELRTPMNAILGFGQMLELDDDKLDQTQRQNVREILDAGNHLLHLINEVLDLAKIESSTVDINREQVVIYDVLQQSINLIKPHAIKRHIEITNLVSKKEHIVYADITRLRQVLVNILSNAVKYNSENGQITLKSEVVDNQRLRISITDTGEGLTVEEIDKLFIPFERLNQNTNIEGTGIGLVIAKKVIELMDGTIGVASMKEEGSTFWIEIALVNKVLNK